MCCTISIHMVQVYQMCTVFHTVLNTHIEKISQSSLSIFYIEMNIS